MAHPLFVSGKTRFCVAVQTEEYFKSLISPPPEIRNAFIGFSESFIGFRKALIGFRETAFSIAVQIEQKFKGLAGSPPKIPILSDGKVYRLGERLQALINGHSRPYCTVVLTPGAIDAPIEITRSSDPLGALSATRKFT